jgi:hyperosmotically inducible protein
MKQLNALFGMIAGAALTLTCAGSYASVTYNLENDNDSHASANIVMADNSSTMRDEDARPAMGGEGDDAAGGNAPNPDPNRSASTVADDAAITAKVKTSLLADTTVSGLKIDVDTLNGVVYLTGDNMNSQAAIDQAIKLAKETDGVVKVVSKLAVVDVKN